MNSVTRATVFLKDLQWGGMICDIPLRSLISDFPETVLKMSEFDSCTSKTWKPCIETDCASVDVTVW